MYTHTHKHTYNGDTGWQTASHVAVHVPFWAPAVEYLLVYDVPYVPGMCPS